ncbi:MAG: arginine deiminase-related protein [Ferruginibacter sp.]
MQASKLLMIQPVNFKFNPETAVNNAFQKDIKESNVQEKALEEFNDFVKLLKENKIDVTVVKDSHEPETPDSIFPNNWISFHEDNSIILYPMFAVNRRLERKGHVLETIKKKFQTNAIHDLTHHEENGFFLEGTGSMVLDRTNRIAYAAVSPRTDLDILNEFCKISNYLPVSFLSKDQYGNTIYHSNVMMCMGHEFVVICLDAIENEIEKEKIRHLLIKTKKEIIDISFEQLSCFAGNMLQVKNMDGELLLIMSTQAYKCLEKSQLTKLESYNKIIHSPLDTIETCGGGSARCMIAEIFNDHLN